MKCLAISFLLLSLFTAFARAGESVIYPFQGVPDGFVPLAGLTIDSAGNLYGTTKLGGTGSCPYGGSPTGCGTIFELSPAGKGGWTETVLYSFQGGKDGQFPFRGLAVDSSGNLYGSTSGQSGTCPSSCGNVFELSHEGKFTVLYTFKASNSHGVNPFTGVAIDSSGALYGTTAPLNGTHGTVFQLANGKLKTLHTFAGGVDGATPASTQLLGADGNWYGTTTMGGENGFGTLYRLSFNTEWHYKVVYSFPETFGGPRDNLAFGANGKLYGVTISDHVFQLTQTKWGKWSGKSLHKFNPFSRQGDGFNVQGGVAVDSSGNVYGLPCPVQGKSDTQAGLSTNSFQVTQSGARRSFTRSRPAMTAKVQLGRLSSVEGAIFTVLPKQEVAAAAAKGSLAELYSNLLRRRAVSDDPASTGNIHLKRGQIGLLRLPNPNFRSHRIPPLFRNPISQPRLCSLG